MPVARNCCAAAILTAIIGLTPHRAPAACLPDLPLNGSSGTAQRLTTIADALLAYQSAHGSLPPAYVADPMGAPLLSWRVLLLPYLGHAALYGQFDLTRAWDDPVNYPLRHQMPVAYGGLADIPFTRYAGVAGTRTAFTGATGVPTSAMTDGPGRTPMIGTIDRNIVWTAPDDIDTDVQPGFDFLAGFHAQDGDCVPFALADASVRFVSATTPLADLAAFYDRADGGAGEPIACLTAGTDNVVQAERIVVRGPVEVEGDLWASDRVLLSKGNGATFAGDVVAGGDLLVRGGNTISGAVVAGGEARVATDATVLGGITSGAPLVPDHNGPGYLDTAGPQFDVHIPAGVHTSLTAADFYGRVTIGTDASLTLANDDVGSIYVMRSLRLGTRARLIVDVGDGPVTIEATRELVFGRESQVSIVPNGDVDADEVCFRQPFPRGSTRIGPEATVLGTLFGGKVLIKSGSRFKGRIFGGKVLLGRDGRYVDLDGTLD